MPTIFAYGFHMDLYFLSLIYINLGALELVQHFHRKNIPIAIATGSHQAAYDNKMATHSDIVSCLSHAVCSDNPLVKNGKPAPDIFLVTAKQFADPPASMDKVYDIRLCDSYNITCTI